MIATDIGTAKIAVIILTLNQRDKTVTCLQSFRSVKSPAFQIFLWDNGSTDGTTEYVQEHFPEVLVHLHPTNLGVASGRNAAAQLAIDKLNPTHLLSIDNDTVVTPDFLDNLLAPFEYDTNLALTSPKIRLLQDDQRLDSAGGAKVQFWLSGTRKIGYGEIDQGQYDTPSRVIATGCCMLILTSVFQEIGGFDSSFDPYGPEDLDFSLRILKEGLEILYVPDSLIFHDPTQTFGGGRYTERYARNKSRHWIRFWGRHASPVEKFGFIFFGVYFVAVRALIREGRRNNLGAVMALFRGMLDWRKPTN